MVTAELAACLPVLALAVLAGLGAVSAADQQVRAQDAASEVARAEARGDDAAARSLFARPRRAEPRSPCRPRPARSPSIVRATVRPLGARLAGFSITERAVAALEPKWRRAGPADRGSASIWVLACAALLLVVAATVAIRASATLARHRAESAADEAALAAAAQIGVGAQPCDAAIDDRPRQRRESSATAGSTWPRTDEADRSRSRSRRPSGCRSWVP